MHFVEDELDGADVGICLDFGHAHLDGRPRRRDRDRARSTSSRRTCTTTAAATDDHLVPFEGTIDWPAALTAMQKVGYDGTLMFEIAAHGADAGDAARSARSARERMERLLADVSGKG